MNKTMRQSLLLIVSWSLVALLCPTLFCSCNNRDEVQANHTELSPFKTAQFEKIVEGFIALAPGNYFRDSVFIDVCIDSVSDFYQVNLSYEIGPSSLSRVQMDNYRGFIQLNDTTYLLIFTDISNTKAYNTLFREQYINTDTSVLKQFGSLHIDYDPFTFDFHLYDDTVLIFEGLTRL